MALGDRYELIMRGTVLGEPQRNVLHFEQFAGGGGAAELAAEFDEEIKPLWQPVFTDQATVTELEVINLDNSTDFATLPVTWVGSGGTGAASTVVPWVCWTFKKVRTDRSFRNGFIRWSGLNETAIQGTAPTAGTLTALNALASQLGLNYVNLAGDEWQMVIRSLPNQSNPNTRYNVISGVSFSHVGSQVSRKTL